MDDLSSSSRSFDSLSFFGRSFSRRSRPAMSRPLPQMGPHSAEVATPRTVVTEAVRTPRTVGQEQTRAAIEHFVAVAHRWAEVRRRQADYRQTHQGASPYDRSRIAVEEAKAWERWLHVIQRALENAEESVVEVVRAWAEGERPERSTDGAKDPVRGVIHQGRLYLALPASDGEGDPGRSRLLVADLRESLNLDGGLAFVDVVTLGPR